MHLYIPLQVRLTCFYVLLLALALWCFGSIVLFQEKQQAYQNLDSTLRSRAASVKLGKYILGQNMLPTLLPGITDRGMEGVAIEVFDSQMHLLATTDSNTQGSFQTSVATTYSSPVPWDKNAAYSLLKRAAAKPEAHDGIYSIITYQGQQTRVYTLTNDVMGELHIIQTAHSEQDIAHSLNEVKQILLNGSIVILLLAALGGWLITRGVLLRVQQMTQIAQNISQERQSGRRIPHQTEKRYDELSHLAKTFNTMLDHLEQLYAYQQRFVADASHELRAPITSICCNLDLLTKASDLPPEEVQEALADTKVEADRMRRLINDLLTLAHSDATKQDDPRKRHARMQIIDLDSLLLEIFRQYQPSKVQSEEGEGKRQPRLLLQNITPVQVLGDLDLLKQALIAVIDNALKYTPPEGTVSLLLSINEQWALITIKDTGIGIAAEDMPHIFERFYRSARTREQHGSGLGLAIAQTILLEHQGTIEISSSSGLGSAFILSIPLLKQAEPFNIN